MDGNLDCAWRCRQLNDGVRAFEEDARALGVAEHEDGVHESRLLRRLALAESSKHLQNCQLEDVAHLVDRVVFRLGNQLLQVGQRLILVHVEQQNERIPLRAEVCLVYAELLDRVDEVLKQLDACGLVDVVQAHDRVSAHIEVPVLQVLRYGLHEVLEDALHCDL